MEKMALSRICSMALAVVAMVGLAGCAGQSLKPLESSAPQAYRLDSGDRVAVSVFGEQAIDGEYEIDGTGSVSLPLAGRVPLRGLTPAQAEDALEKRLAGTLQNPQANVSVVRYRPFYILGEVQRPGAYSFYNGATVLNAVALAGGYTFRARTGNISVVRPEDGAAEQEPQLASEDAYLQPGDIVIVPPRWF